MTAFLILVFCNSVFLLVCFWYFRKKINDTLYLRETEQQISQFITSFNTNAEINLQLMQDQEKRMRALLHDCKSIQQRLEKNDFKKPFSNAKNGHLNENSFAKIANNANGLNPTAPLAKTSAGKNRTAEKTTKSIADEKNIGLKNKGKAFKTPFKTPLQPPSVDDKLKNLKKEKATASAHKTTAVTKQTSFESDKSVVGNKLSKTKKAHSIDGDFSKKIAQTQQKHTTLKSSLTPSVLASQSLAQQAYQLYAQGKTKAAIAKEMGLDIAEIQLSISVQQAEKNALQKKKQKIVASQFLQ